MKTENHNLTELQYCEITAKYYYYYSNILDKWIYDYSYFNTKNELLNYLIKLENINQ